MDGPSARMVLVNNATTHGVMFDDNACTTNTEFAYLNSGVMPARDVVCQAAADALLRHAGHRDL